MIGVGFVIDEALNLREHTGRVSDVTWSKIQATPVTVARTQAYALRQLDALAEKLERKKGMADLASNAKVAESKVEEWLAVLARCFQLQDAIAVLELDRVLDSSPDELDKHRLGVKAARRSRLELITKSTHSLMARMDTAAGAANSKVLLHPIDSRAVVNSSNRVASDVVEFHMRLGIGEDRESMDAKRWVDAAVEVKDKVFETGAEGVDAATRLGAQGLDQARTMTGKLAGSIAERASRLRDAVEKRDDDH
jgi:hypothetical protein